MTYPRPMTRPMACNPLGRRGLFGDQENFPKGEDFGYLIWKKLIAVSINPLSLVFYFVFPPIWSVSSVMLLRGRNCSS
jgi:hypothetical protein